MKKQVRFLLISIVIVIVGVASYVGILQKKEEKSILDRIPISKPHQHVVPEGEVVEHTHPPILPPAAPSKTTTPDTIAEHSILRVWDNLDLAAIKRDYQPHTVPEMIEKWEEEYKTFENPSRGLVARGEDYWPKEAWLQHLLDNGYPFLIFGQYKMASDLRFQMLQDKSEFDNPETRLNILKGYRLPEDATWEELEEVRIKFSIVARLNTQRAVDRDPSIAGGITDLNGVYTPFSPNTVYVHVSEDKPLSTFTGAMLSEEQKNDITMYGVAPKGVTVIYTDENGNPMPSGLPPPRFYERQMAALEAVEEHVEKLIADHEALFKSQSEKTQKIVPPLTTPSQDERLHPHPHDKSDGQENAQRPSQRPGGPESKREFPFDILPPEPPGPHNIQLWFEILQEWHGGDLPRDLRELQQVIKELDAIRQAGEERMQPKGTPPGHRSPERSKPKAPTPSELPAAQE